MEQGREQLGAIVLALLVAAIGAPVRPETLGELAAAAERADLFRVERHAPSWRAAAD